MNFGLGDKARFGLALSSTIHHPLIIAKLNKVQLEGFKARRMNQALKGRQNVGISACWKMGFSLLARAPIKLRFAHDSGGRKSLNF